jgi:hypothetical protein
VGPAPLYFVQVKPTTDARWITVAAGGVRAQAQRAADREWRYVARCLDDGAVYRVVSERDLDSEGGEVAVARAIASLHAESLRAQHWLDLE